MIISNNLSCSVSLSIPLGAVRHGVKGGRDATEPVNVEFKSAAEFDACVFDRDGTDDDTLATVAEAEDTDAQWSEMVEFWKKLILKR